MNQLEREHAALRLRYRALSDDWHRMRDVERDWSNLRRIAFGALAFLMLTSALAVLMGWA